MRRAIWAVLLIGYAFAAFAFVGKPIPTCLGLGDQSPCIARWEASLTPVEHVLYDTPLPLPSIIVFLVLVGVTLALDWLVRRVRRWGEVRGG